MRGRVDGRGSGPQRRSDWWGVVVDASDARALARWYAALLDWAVQNEDDGWVGIGPGEGVAYLAFQTCEGYESPTWPHRPGHQQMQMHLDFEVSDLDAATAHAVELGAVLAAHQPQDGSRVLLDPQGHPFCLYE